MSRTSTSTTQTSSSGRLDPSPPAFTPSLSRETRHASQSSLPSFSPSNAIDDFVLFPEDSSSWGADMSFPELETQDLGQFNFDINDIDLTDYPSMNTDQSFDFSFDQQPFSFQPDTQPAYTPNMNDQYSLDQWAEPQGFMPISHSQPHPAGPSGDSGQLDANWQFGWLQSESLISPITATFADNYWRDALVDHPQIPQNSAVNDSPLLSDAPDWSLLESTIVANSSSSGGETANNRLSQASEPRRSRKRRAVDEQESGETFEQLGQGNVIRNSPDIGLLDPSDLQQLEGVHPQAGSKTSLAKVLLDQECPEFSVASSKVSQEISRLQNFAQYVSKSLRSIRRASVEYTELGVELQQLEGVLARLSSSQYTETILSDSSMTMIESLRTQLEVLSSRGERSRSSGGRRHKLGADLHPDHARELQIAARRLIQSLCVTINIFEVFNTGTTSPTNNRPTLTSGGILQRQVPPSESLDEKQPQTLGSGIQSSGSTSWQSSRSLSANSGVETTEAVLQRANGNIETLDIYPDVDSVCSPTRNEHDAVAAEALTVRSVRRYSTLLKSRSSDLPPHGVENSRPIERSEQLNGDIHFTIESNRLVSPLSSFNPNETLRRMLFSGQIRPGPNLQDEQTGGLATIQQVCFDVATPSPTADRIVWHSVDDTRPSATGSTSLAVLQETSTQVFPSSSAESTLQIPTSLQSLSNFVLQTAPTNVFDTQFSFVAALTIIGSLALASNVWHPPLPNTLPPPSPFVF